MMGTQYTICHWAINRSDPQNLLSVILDVPLQKRYLVLTIRCLTPTPSLFSGIRRFIEGETEDDKNRKELSQERTKLSNYD